MQEPDGMRLPVHKKVARAEVPLERRTIGEQRTEYKSHVPILYNLHCSFDKGQGSSETTARISPATSHKRINYRNSRPRQIPHFHSALLQRSCTNHIASIRVYRGAAWKSSACGLSLASLLWWRNAAHGIAVCSLIPSTGQRTSTTHRLHSPGGKSVWKS